MDFRVNVQVNDEGLRVRLSNRGWWWRRARAYHRVALVFLLSRGRLANPLAQRFARAADLRRNHCPLRSVIAPVLLHHPNRARPDFRRKFVRRFLIRFRDPILKSWGLRRTGGGSASGVADRLFGARSIDQRARALPIGPNRVRAWGRCSFAAGPCFSKLQHRFVRFRLGFASCRIRMWRSEMNLASLANRPTESALA